MSNKSTYVKALDEQSEVDPGAAPVVNVPRPASIIDNLTTILDELGIKGFQFVDIEPDRVFGIDRLGQLQAHIDAHPEHWHEDPFDPFHESIVGSWRERCHPSLQACKRAISQINPNHPDALFRWELDIDFSPTDSLRDFVEHSLEVLDNEFTGHLTNQQKVARLLAQRFAPKETTDGQPA